MRRHLALLFLLSFISAIAARFDLLSPEDKCIANIRAEINGRTVSRNLGGIVGIGWDDLTNTATLPILAISYNQCRSVPDGDWLIPDNVVVFPIREANIMQSSAIYDSYSSYKLDVGMSMKTSMSATIPGIGGGGGHFSMEAQIGKKHMEKHQQKCFENKVQYHAFDLIATESAGFEKAFTDRLDEIADNVKDGNFLLGQYNAECLIADYGTHVTNKALAGAMIQMLTFIQTDNESDTNSMKTKLSGGFQANVMGLASTKTEMSGSVDFAADSGHSSSTSQTYTITKGGPDVNKLFGQSPDGSKLSIDSLVGLDRHGIPLFNLIHKGVSDKSDAKTIKMVQDLIYNATLEYYKQNTIPGCQTARYINYFYRGNVNDANCFLPLSAYQFMNDDHYIGGVFQQCEHISSSSQLHPALPHENVCDGYNIPNPFTKNFTCIEKTEAEEIESFYMTFKHRVQSVNELNCTSTAGCLKNYTITDEIRIRNFWCKVTVGDPPVYQNRIRFGGIFSSENIFSENTRCPDGFLEYPFFHNLKICMAREKRKTGSGIALFDGIAFAGIITCHDKFAQCPDQYSKYLAATIDGCSYYYCAMCYGVMCNGSPKVIKPPYIDRDLAMSQTRYNYRQKTKKFEGKYEIYEGWVYD